MSPEINRKNFIEWKYGRYNVYKIQNIAKVHKEKIPRETWYSSKFITTVEVHLPNLFQYITKVHGKKYLTDKRTYFVYTFLEVVNNNIKYYVRKLGADGCERSL